jgi:hypothetical protein
MLLNRQMNDTLASVLISLDTKDHTEAVSMPTGSLSSISMHESKHYATSSDQSAHEERKKQKYNFPTASWAKPSSYSSTSQSEDSSISQTFMTAHQGNWEPREKFSRDFIQGF